MTYIIPIVGVKTCQAASTGSAEASLSLPAIELSMETPRYDDQVPVLTAFEDALLLHPQSYPLDPHKALDHACLQARQKRISDAELIEALVEVMKTRAMQLDHHGPTLP